MTISQPIKPVAPVTSTSCIGKPHLFCRKVLANVISSTLVLQRLFTRQRPGAFVCSIYLTWN